jgi:hypothetical protein
MVIQIVTIREIQDADFNNYAYGLQRETGIDAEELIKTGQTQRADRIPGLSRVATQYKVFRGITLEQYVETATGG